MAERDTNKVPWTEIVSGISATDRQRARSAQRFFEKRRFANNKNLNARGFVKRLTSSVFDRNLSILDIAQRICDEVRENTDAKALNLCVSKIEQLGHEGWCRVSDEKRVIFHSVQLEIQLQPHTVLEDEHGNFLLLYVYFRRSPPLNTDAIRGLLYLIKQAPQISNYKDARIVILDCYNDRSFEASDFKENEPWIAKQITKVLSTYNAGYRIHLDGGSPPAAKSSTTSRRTRGGRATSVATFSMRPRENQLSLSFG